ncbi:Elongator subunit elp4 [Coemansia brasiliensis]|uniref:Elongator complex protein 4 n=1 Tax=Coemansia brasiliensis TaxID=2650707 RepID=A0A9W8IA17_9FUNG|nr:Elongator subunit elp4 [Coemansia brasiliensis]
MSSFRKRVPESQVKLPPATRLNPHSAQLLVSTGVPSLDDLLGGGMPVGGILMIEEDRQTGYSNTLLSYFSSQAIAAGHKLCVVNADQGVDLKAQLPGWTTSETSQVETSASSRKDDEAMKIAWRYQNMPRVDSDDTPVGAGSAGSQEVPFCDRFDLMLRIQPQAVDQAQVEIIDESRLFDMANSAKYGGDIYECVLDKISEMINDGFSSLKPASTLAANRNILRIELASLGSGFWSGSNSLSILKFLYRLRGMLRYSYAVCMISFPVHLYEESGVRLPIVRRIEHLCDAVIELESFEGTYAKPADIVARQMKGSTATQEYHGFVHIHKLPRLNSLTASMGRLSLLHTGGGSANNLAFRLRRKKFSIETYHLPIEGGVSERRVPKDDPKALRPGISVGGMGCGSTPGRQDPLEF